MLSSVAQDRRRRLVAAANHQRRFGQSIARVERLAPEAARRERLGKSLERLREDWFSAVERQIPAAQIQRLTLLGRDALNAQVICEVRRAAGRRAVARD